MNNTLTGPVALITSSWAFYKQHARKLTGIILWPLVGIFVVAVLGQAGKSDPSGALFGILALLIMIVTMVFMVAATNALIRHIDTLSKDPASQPSLGSLYKFGFSYFWAFVLVAIIRGLGMTGSTMLFIIPGIVFGVYSMFMLYALIVDDKHGLSAFTESFAVVRGRWWKVLGRALWLALWYVIAVLVLAGVEFLLRKIFGYGAASLVNGVVSGLFNALLMLVFVPFSTTYLYKLYVELRITRMQGETTVFKRWLIAFIVIGVLGGVMMFLALPLVALNEARMKAQSLQNQDTVLTGTDTTSTDGNLVK